MARKFGIWFFGLLASGVFGGLVGNYLDYMHGSFLGFLAGMFAFSCFRLWRGDSSPKTSA